MVTAATKTRRLKAKRAIGIVRMQRKREPLPLPLPKPKRERVRLGDIKSIIGRTKTLRVSKGLKETLKQYGQGEVIKERAVSSSWVAMIHLVRWQNHPALAVTFRNGVSVVYRHSGLRDYETMSGAPSKGKYIWRALYHGIPGAGAPYTIVVF